MRGTTWPPQPDFPPCHIHWRTAARDTGCAVWTYSSSSECWPVTYMLRHLMILSMPSLKCAGSTSSTAPSSDSLSLWPILQKLFFPQKCPPPLPSLPPLGGSWQQWRSRCPSTAERLTVSRRHTLIPLLKQHLSVCGGCRPCAPYRTDVEQVFNFYRSVVERGTLSFLLQAEKNNKQYWANIRFFLFFSSLSWLVMLIQTLSTLGCC